MKRITTAVLAALVLGAGGASAQIAPGGGPIDIGSDRLEVNNQARSATWSGRVELLQGQNRLRADTLTLYFTGAAPAAGTPAGDWGDVDRMEAVGNVYFVTPEQTVRGARAVYTPRNDTIVLSGDVVIAQGENVVRGERLTIQVATGRSTMEGSAAQGGRVRGVFFPEQGRQGGGR